MKLELSSSTNSNPNPNFYNPYVAYFEFWYRLGLSPFKLHVCHKTGECRVVQASWRRKILNIFWPIFSFMYAFTVFYRRQKFFRQREQGADYFLIGVAYGVLILQCCFFGSIWRKAKSFEDLVSFYNTLAGTQNYTSKDVKKTFRMIWLTITQIQLLSLLRYMEKSAWSFGRVYTEEFCDIGKELVLFMSIDIEKIDFLPKFLLGLVGAVLFITYYLVKSAVASLLFISVNEMRRYLLSIQGEFKLKSPFEVLGEFLNLKSLLRKNKNAVGLVQFGLFLRQFPVLFMVIPEIMKPDGLFQLLKNLWSPAITMAIFIFAVWFTNEANNIFEDWLSEMKNLPSLPEPYLSLVLHHLGNGGFQYEAFGFIKFTSAFFGQVLCMVFTFAAIIIQY